jgi:hypothetical protein
MASWEVVLCNESCPPAVLERHLAELAVRARSSKEQSQLMSEGLHLTLPVLLARQPPPAFVSPASIEPGKGPFEVSKGGND